MSRSPALAADVVCVSWRRGRLEVLLVRRRNAPFAGCWALPGGFVDPGEDLPEAAARELEEETGLVVSALYPLGVYGAPERDPRQRVVSTVFLAPLPPDAPEATAGDDAAEAAWSSLGRPPRTAFDHRRILADARWEIRRRTETVAFGLRLAPAEFTARELVDLHRAILGRTVDLSNLDGLLVPAGRQQRVDLEFLDEVEGRGYLFSLFE